MFNSLIMAILQKKLSPRGGRDVAILVVCDVVKMFVKKLGASLPGVVHVDQSEKLR